jgi:hypothetical protein
MPDSAALSHGGDFGGAAISTAHGAIFEDKNYKVVTCTIFDLHSSVEMDNIDKDTEQPAMDEHLFVPSHIDGFVVAFYIDVPTTDDTTFDI